MEFLNSSQKYKSKKRKRKISIIKRRENIYTIGKIAVAITVNLSYTSPLSSSVSLSVAT